ncbi:MAG TPA: SHOCT domain-containing protein [Bacillota bacterium]|nr:SHOCT domain-containing protein [Bacillota bacterium]
MLTENAVRLVFFVLVVIALVVILIRFTVGSKEAQKDSLDIIEEKYKNGDITKEEYDAALKKRGKK